MSLVVPFPPGAATDAFARLVAERNEGLAAFIRTETAKYARIAKAAKLKLDD